MSVMAHLLKVVAADNAAFKTTIGADLQTLNPAYLAINSASYVPSTGQKKSALHSALFCLQS